MVCILARMQLWAHPLINSFGSLLIKRLSAGKKEWWNRPGYHTYKEIEEVLPYPFVIGKAEDGKDAGVIIMQAPFFEDYYKV